MILSEEIPKAHTERREDRDGKRGMDACQRFTPDILKAEAGCLFLAHSFCTLTCQHETPSRGGAAMSLFWNPAGLPCKRLSCRCLCGREKSVNCVNYRK